MSHSCHGIRLQDVFASTCLHYDEKTLRKFELYLMFFKEQSDVSLICFELAG